MLHCALLVGEAEHRDEAGRDGTGVPRRFLWRSGGLLLAALLLGAMPAPADDLPGEIQGELSIAVRGSGAAPFGIASALFGSTNLAYHLGELQDSVKEGLGGRMTRFSFGTSPLPADESYQGILKFTLRRVSARRNVWRLVRLSFDYDAVDRTRLAEGDVVLEDAMNDGGWVSWDLGAWHGPAGWEPGQKPKIELRVFEAPAADRCQEGGFRRWMTRARSLVTDTSDWVSCFELDVVALHPLRPSGTSQWSAPVGGVTVTARDGELELSGTSGIDLASLPLPAELPPDAREFFEQGVAFQRWLGSGFLKLDPDMEMTVERSFSGTLEKGAIKEDVPYTILTGAQVRERLFVPLYAVRADPGGPYTVLRGEPLQLDGTRSTGPNLRYEWHFERATAATEGDGGGGGGDGGLGDEEHCVSLGGILDAKQGREPRFDDKAKKTDPRPEVILLASTEIILKVVDEGTRIEDVASTIATVKDRDFSTAFSHESNWDQTPPGWQSMWGFPAGTAQTPEEQRRAAPEDRDLCKITEAYQLGENWCRGAHPGRIARGTEQMGVIHPHGRLVYGTWLDHGYEIARVDDPGGPFDGQFYVVSTNLEVRREGVFSPVVRPDGPVSPGADENFSQANQRLGVSVADIRAGLERHEGMGSGPLDSGHSIIFKKTLDAVDPSHEIEDLVAGDRRELQRTADALIDAADLCMAERSQDPINKMNWTDRYWVFDGSARRWCQVQDEI